MHDHHPTTTGRDNLRLVFWETTTACNLKCIHCRASVAENRPPDELSLEDSRDLLRSIASFARPVVVLSGGEPLIREDIFDIASFGTDLGLRMVLATNGTLLTREAAEVAARSDMKCVVDGPVLRERCYELFTDRRMLKAFRLWSTRKRK